MTIDQKCTRAHTPAKKPDLPSPLKDLIGSVYATDDIREIELLTDTLREFFLEDVKVFTPPMRFVLDSIAALNGMWEYLVLLIFIRKSHIADAMACSSARKLASTLRSVRSTNQFSAYFTLLIFSYLTAREFDARMRRVRTLARRESQSRGHVEVSGFALRLTRIAVVFLPRPFRARYREEYAAELYELSFVSRRAQWRYALNLLAAAWLLRRALARAARQPAQQG